MSCARNLPRVKTRVRPAGADAEKIGKLIRLLASDKSGEVVAAASALKRTLAASGRDLHDLADLIEAGLRPAPQLSGPPAPKPDDWQSMAWFCHHHRWRLPVHHRELVEDLLLGRGDAFDDGQIRNWAIEELRRLAAGLRPAA